MKQPLKFLSVAKCRLSDKLPQRHEQRVLKSLEGVALKLSTVLLHNRKRNYFEANNDF